MVDYNNILNMISLLLAFSILFMILFGCKCQITTPVKERFENNEEKKEEIEDFKLSDFEKKILDGLTTGTLTTPNLTNLIKTEAFTEKNLENLIGYVEKFKGGMKS